MVDAYLSEDDTHTNKGNNGASLFESCFVYIFLFNTSGKNARYLRKASSVLILHLHEADSLVITV